jgi:4-amino-4-deoxy-L-arabinose transferase-like glycosyltransferase
MNLSSLARATILAILCLISFFSLLDAVDVDLMEARNFVTAREMVADHHWLIPTMNGEIRLAKPPLPTWLAAVSSMLAVSGGNLTLLRLPSALAACLLIVAILGLCRTMGREPQQGFLSAAMLATSLLAIDVGRTGTWDIFCHAFMAVALWALWTGVRRKTGAWSFVVAGAALGLSFMSKGPVSFYALFLPFTLAYLAVYGLGEIKNAGKGLLLALIISLLISCWWPLYIFISHADLGLSVAQKEKEAWSDRHVQPFWYYWHFVVFSGGWLLWAFAALIRPYAGRRSADQKKHTFMLLWLAAAIILLSLIPEKKERYLLPAMIPLFLLAGDLAHGVIARFSAKRDLAADRALVQGHTALMTLLAVTLPVVLIVLVNRQGHAVDGWLLGYGLLAWSTAWLLIKSLRGRQVERLMLTTMAFLALTTLTVLHYYGALTIKNKGYKTMDSRQVERQIGQAKVYFLGDPVDMRVIWDLGRRVYPWQGDEITRRVAQGEPVAVLSKGEPLPLLPNKLREQILVTAIDSFDYGKRRPDRQPIHLSLLQPQGTLPH